MTMNYEGIVSWLVGQTCFYVEDIQGLQTPLELEKPAGWPEEGSSKDMLYCTISMAKAEYVYVMTSDENKEVSKIGRSRDPEKRLKTLQTGSPYKLRVACDYGPLTRKSCIVLESHVHKLLHTKRLEGEWFNLAPEDARLIIRDVINNANITHEVPY